jgi:hypothetical protein
VKASASFFEKKAKKLHPSGSWGDGGEATGL